ncbi:MAG: hypothetical protein GX640_10870 [Fibrobacter sp.]|nr:hypothetical protein [Fibrobacter sp.]
MRKLIVLRDVIVFAAETASRQSSPFKKRAPQKKVNYNNGHKSEFLKNEEKSRYLRLFASNVEYTELSFSDFSKNLYGII